MVQRTRNRSEAHSAAVSRKWFRLSDNALLTNGTGTVSWVDLDSMVDHTIPKFRKRSARGEIFVNPMEQHRSKSFQTDRGVWGSQGKTQYYRVYSEPYQPPKLDLVGLNGTIERLEALAITDAYAKVGAPAVETLTELVELRETLSFLYSPVKGIISLTKQARNYQKSYDRWESAFKKRMARWESLSSVQRKKTPKPVSKPPTGKLGKLEVTDLTSLWLAYRYAVMPLVYTFQDIQKLLQEQGRNEQPTRATARAKSSEKIDDETYGTAVDSLSLDNGSGSLKYEWWTNRSINISCRAGVLYVPDWSLQARTGVQLNRLPKALYEGIPLTFVSDWFHNGASYYDALTADFRALKIHGAWVTTLIEYVISFDTATGVNPAAVNTTVFNGSRKTVVSTSGTWKRRRKASLKDVQFLLRLEMNGKRIADGLALAYNMLDAAVKRKK